MISSRSLVLSIAILSFVSPAFAAGPTASDPQYTKAGLWPDDVRKTAYATETWAKAPLFVWAVKGKDGQQTDPKDAANWKVDGKAATSAPGENDDIHFPAESAIRLKENTSLTVRHVTVDAGVRVPKSLRIRPMGNVWIKEKGSARR